MTYDVIIIGAGAAGLMAARELLRAGRRVCILEAGEDAGGRISTFNDPAFDSHLERGAEFVHGRLPITLRLLQEAGLEAEPVSGHMIHVKNGTWQTGEEDEEHWPLFMKQAAGLTHDMTVSHFLDRYFPAGAFDALRDSVRRFAEGFDLADIDRAVVLPLVEEWQHENEPQFRVLGGYGRMIRFLAEYAKNSNAFVQMNTVVHNVVHDPGGVTVHTRGGESFRALRIIVTASPAVLASDLITFEPFLQGYKEMLLKIGFGTVIKIHASFRSAFWNDYGEKTGFILSNEAIPTWWTQMPRDAKYLTGWLGGASAAKYQVLAEEQLRQLSVRSLAGIFRLRESLVDKEMHSFCATTWGRQPHVLGGYSYITEGTAAARAFFSKPLNGVLHFAGEAFSASQSLGTVEAALRSGMDTAHAIIESSL